MNAVAEKYGNTQVSNEMLLSRFSKLAKDHFQISLKTDHDQINIIKESIRFFSLDLPQELKEIFISANDAPLFWIFESTLLSQIEDFLKFNFKGGANTEVHKQIKDSYTRWATTKLKSEKEYFSNTTINFIERDINKHNFFKLILKGIIYSYQTTFYNYARALELFSSVLDLVDSLRLNDQLKIELKYIVQLYIGFLHLKENDYEKAHSAFKDALEVKPAGCTAKLFCALSEVNLGEDESAIFHIREVFLYDVQRLGIALKTNNAPMFNYFYRNAFIYNIFQERDFAKISELLQTLFAEFRTHEEGLLEKCLENVGSIKMQKLEEYYNDEIKKNLGSLEKIIPVYAKSDNTLLFALFKEFKEKNNGVINGIVGKVREVFYAEVRQRLSSYDQVIKDNLSAEKHLKDEIEIFKEKSRENLTQTLSKINENFENDAKAVESKINELPNVDRYNPRLSLSNNMTYNIIIACIVFFIGGVTGYSNQVVDDVSGFNSMLASIVVSGTKWGAISFLVGVVIALVLSATILMERYEIKSKLQRRLSYLKVEKERALSDAKEMTSEREKMMIENMNSSIAQHKKHAEEVKEQRALADKELTAQADLKVAEITADIQKLIME